MKDSSDRYVYRVLLAAVLTVLAVGTVFYHFVEHFSWLNSYYFSVITLATVGYGDFVPHTDAGKIFTTFYVMVGIGIVTTFISYTMKRREDKFMKKHSKSNADEK